MDNWFLDDQIVNILKVGLSGFAFLVLLMSYFLLKAEQKREDEARESILKSIHKFTYVSIIFVVIVGGFSVVELFVKPTSTSGANKKCQESIEQMRLLSKSPQQTKESLVQLIENLSEDCMESNEMIID
ncbi:hypothetical protein [Reichenbachiella sp. MSK19-1]|uniref:hypothetical protein n=1 Tax=Reichenbachiella sp. MSK19-1 TaxID=1897631 RepID=UPI000E6C18BA|nr:hypothetical protein [Reichenbachiella sp. MSK19-1]RJE74955.1 hypothetical protein BGP76_17705 [Reichenbachiella sp. MSK19-1]